MGVLAGFGEVNYVAVLVAGVAYFLIGGLWYSNLLFAKPWIANVGITWEEAKRTHGAPLYIATALLGLVSTLVLALFLGRAAGAAGGMITGLVAGLGLTGAPMVINGLFSNQRLRLTAIQAGHHVVALTVAGLIIGSWQ